MMKALKHIQCMAVVLCGVATLWSCSKGENIIPKDTAAPIHFTTSDNWAESRLVTDAEGKTTFQDDDKMGIYAYYYPKGNGSGEEFMINQETTYDKDEDLWEYSPVKYWPTMTDDELSFYAYYPHSATATGDEVTIGIDGAKDVMWAATVNNKFAETEGNRHQYGDGAAITFGFQHLLMKLSFIFVQGEGFGDKRYVETLQISELKNTMKLNVKTGTPQFEGSGVLTLSDTNDDKVHRYLIHPSHDALPIGDVMYIDYEPTETGERVKVLKFTIVIQGKEYSPSVTLKNPQAGKSYQIKLTFTNTAVQPSVMLTDWNSSTLVEGGVIEGVTE